MHDADDNPRIRRKRFVPCLDDRGEPTVVGAGVTTDDQVVLLGPPDGAAVLTAAQEQTYLEVVTEMLVTATAPER
jgi:hypothetical protein